MRNVPQGAGIFTEPMSDHSDARVLLVQSPGDDGLDMYAEFLHYHGFVPMSVTNAHDALNVAPAAAVIVTGILLHDSMDGIELIDCLRGDDRTKNTPIIVLTACAWPTDRIRATDAGCDAFLPKPCLPDELLREVRRLLASPCGERVQPVRTPGVDARMSGTVNEHVVNRNGGRVGHLHRHPDGGHPRQSSH